MIKYPEYPYIKPTKNNTVVLIDYYEVYGIKIPKGFESDGLTLKNRLFRIVVSKYSPKFTPFFIVHDYLCNLHLYKLADIIGERVLFDIEYSLRTRLMMSMVKLYHWYKYGVKF